MPLVTMESVRFGSCCLFVVVAAAAAAGQNKSTSLLIVVILLPKMNMVDSKFAPMDRLVNKQQQQQHRLIDKNDVHGCREKSVMDSNNSPFSAVEQIVLSALLLDPRINDDDDGERNEGTLNQEMLFSTASCVDRLNVTKSSPAIEPPPTATTTRRAAATGDAVAAIRPNYRLQVGLWQAHEDGVTHRQLSKMASVLSSASRHSIGGDFDSQIGMATGRSTVATDEEVRGGGDGGSRNHDCFFEEDSIASQDEDDQCFDAWQILKDEYAKDFGFDYTPGTHAVSFSDDDDDDDSRCEDGDDENDRRSDTDNSNSGGRDKKSRRRHNTFKILGTGVDDKSAHPHVLSPPLMDRLLSYVPKHLRGQNFWMRFSMIRDGASLETLKNSARATKDSILAIETTKGEVFGVFTSRPWKANPSAFGGPPAYVWRMRSSRMKKCYSLWEVAERENQIDVWEADEFSICKLQMLTKNRLGVGMGNMNKFNEVGEVVETEADEEKKKGKNYGFAIALEDDLLSGTTSRSPVFQNPCLVDDSSNGEAFETLNVELWTLTPAFSEDSAQKIEMSQHFITESIRSSNSSSRNGNATTHTSSRFSSRDLDQAKFFRRVGKGDDENEPIRSHWWS